MRKTLIAAVALVAMTAAFAAVAAGGTGSAKQHVRIDIKGADPFAFVLKPTSRGGVQPDVGTATFCCWSSWDVIRAGAKVEVTNPRLTLGGQSGRLTIRERIEWTPLPDGWSVFTGTWKVVGGVRDYAGFSGHGRVAGAWAPETDPNRALRLRLSGFLEPK